MFSSASLRSQYFISTDELQKQLDQKADMKLVNATWYMPNSDHDAWREHLCSRITLDTVFFDHDEVCDK